MTEAEAKVKVGVFGVGALGQHHARIYSEMDESELTGVYDVNGERAAEMAKAHGTTAFDSIEELASCIDAASIAVPTHLHYELALSLIEHDVHLLIEKPIASTTAEAEEIIRMVRNRGLSLQVGHIERFNPVMQFLEDQLERPRFIEAIRLSPYPPPREGNIPRGTEVSVVLDLMIHDLDIILQLVKSVPKEIHAVGVTVLSPTEDIANVRIAFENGCVANITASRVSQERMRKVRVFQEDTYVSLDYMNQAGQICKRNGTAIEARDVPLEREEPLLAELSSFIHCIRTRRTPVVTGEHASEALSLAVEICRHIREEPS